MNTTRSINPSPLISIPSVFNDNRKSWIIITGIALAVLSAIAALALGNPGSLFGHFCYIKISIAMAAVALAVPLALLYYWKKTQPIKPIEFDFREKRELIDETSDPNAIWNGIKIPAQAPDERGYLETLQKEAGQTFALYFDASRNRFTKKEFYGELNERQFERDILGEAYCDKGEHFSGLGKPVDRDRVISLMEGFYPNNPSMTIRAKNLSNQIVPNTIVITLLQPRYNVYSASPITLKDYAKENSNPVIYCNFFKAESAPLIIEHAMTKEISINGKRSGYFIPLISRVNVESGDITLIWKVIKSSNPDSDPALDPYHLLTKKAD